MKEHDLDKCLENIIIDGIIKEAEQDSADLAAAMRQMSDEEFIALVDTTRPTSTFCASFSKSFRNFEVFGEPENNYNCVAEEKRRCSAESQEPTTQSIVLAKGQSFSFTPASKRRSPWLAVAAVVAAVCILSVILVVNHRNNALCDRALIMAMSYGVPNNTIVYFEEPSIAEVKAQLPALKQRYEASFTEQDGTTIYTDDFLPAGWDLAMAYLALHRKADATKVLRQLADRAQATPFGDLCRDILRTLN